MTAPTELLADLKRRGVILEAIGDRLRVDAPAGMLTPELRQALVVHKAELLELLAPAGNPAPTVTGDSASAEPASPAGMSPLDALRPYLGRWLFPSEAAEARALAAELGVELAWERWQL